MEDLGGVVTREDVARCVKVIARVYATELANSRRSVRPGAVLKRFREIRETAEKLSDALQSLSSDERRVLVGHDFEFLDWPTLAGDTPAKRKWLFGEVIGMLPEPELIPREDELPPSDLVDLLRSLTKFMTWRLEHLGDALSDRGGRGNLRTRTVGSPSRVLIDYGWRLISRAPHLRPSGTEDGALHQLTCYVHEWATGERPEASEFVAPLKKYARARRQHDLLLLRFHELESRGADYSPRDLYLALGGFDHGDRVPPEVLHEAEELLAKMGPLRRAFFKG